MFTQDIKCLEWADRYIVNLSKKDDFDWDEPEHKEKILVIDAGMNEGDFALLAVTYFQSQNILVHGFEPNKHINLRQELSLSPTKIIQNNLGLSDVKGTQILYVPTKHQEKISTSHVSSLINRPVFAGWKDTRIEEQEVAITTLDFYCQKNKIDKINYLKIDVEGNELKVLQGAKQLLLNKKVNAGQFEYGSTFDDSGSTLEEVVFYLDNLGYSCFLGPITAQNKFTNDNIAHLMSLSPDRWENIIFVNKELLDF